MYSENSNDVRFELSTFDTYDCLFFPLLSNEIEIKVYAKYGIHIFLFSEPNRDHNFYEIIVSGWSNTKSVIRSQKDKELVVNKSSNLINRYGCINLIVKYDKLYHRIVVMKAECEEYPAMIYRNDEYLPEFKYIGFHTEGVAAGDWIIKMKGTNYTIPSYTMHKPIEFYTGTKYAYQYIKFQSKIIIIEVQSANDVYIRLGTNPKNYYEFIIGEYKNTWSKLKFTNTVVCSAETKGILNKGKKRKFIIKMNEDCICINEGNNKHPFLVHRGKNLKYNSIGVCTYGVPGLWSIDVGQPYKENKKI